jgi:hypothetical protein
MFLIQAKISHPPPKSNLRHPRRGGGNVLGRQTGLWSTEAKVWGIVPKAAWHWGGDSSVVNDPFGAHSVVCMPSTCMGLCWWSPFNSPILLGLIWTTRNLQKKMVKALAEFKFCHLGKHFYGTKRLWSDSVLYSTVLCQRYGTSSGIKQMGTHNRSENGCSAWFTLCAHPTSTDTDTDTSIQRQSCYMLDFGFKKHHLLCSYLGY